MLFYVVYMVTRSLMGLRQHLYPLEIDIQGQSTESQSEEANDVTESRRPVEAPQSERPRRAAAIDADTVSWGA